jgi:cyclase
MDLESISLHAVACTSIERSGNVGGIALRNFSAAVDSTNSPNNGKMFKKALEKHFGLPVKLLILTHYHTDHRQGIPSFNDSLIICNEKTVRNIPKSSRSKVVSALVFETSLTITDRDLSITICHAGGHTSDSTFVYFPCDNIVFAGDLIFEGRFPFASDKTCNPDQWIAALEQLKSLDADIIVPGHGPVLDRNGLDTHIALFKSVKAAVKDAICEKKTAKIDVPELNALSAIDKRPGRKSSFISGMYSYYKKLKN